MSSCSTRPPKVHYGSSSSVASSASGSDSDLSYSSAGSATVDSMPLPVASVYVLRCLRCARAVEVTTTDDPQSSGMVRIGTNIYYCQRCAKMVGYK